VVAALWIVLLGMVIIFTVLSVLLGVITLLNRLFKPEVKDRS